MMHFVFEFSSTKHSDTDPKVKVTTLRRTEL